MLLMHFHSLSVGHSIGIALVPRQNVRAWSPVPQAMTAESLFCPTSCNLMQVSMPSTAPHIKIAPHYSVMHMLLRPIQILSVLKQCHRMCQGMQYCVYILAKFLPYKLFHAGRLTTLETVWRCSSWLALIPCVDLVSGGSDVSVPAASVLPDGWFFELFDWSFHILKRIRCNPA